MTENERYIVDDAGTLIDIQTRECYDFVEEVVDLLNMQEETIKGLDKYCTACDDTLLTIQELTCKLLNVVFVGAESKADYCRLLNELDDKDLSFIHDSIKAINKCDLMGMEQLKNRGLIK